MVFYKMCAKQHPLFKMVIYDDLWGLRSLDDEWIPIWGDTEEDEDARDDFLRRHHEQFWNAVRAIQVRKIFKFIPIHSSINLILPTLVQ